MTQLPNWLTRALAGDKSIELTEADRLYMEDFKRTEALRIGLEVEKAKYEMPRYVVDVSAVAPEKVAECAATGNLAPLLDQPIKLYQEAATRKRCNECNGLTGDHCKDGPDCDHDSCEKLMHHLFVEEVIL